MYPEKKESLREEKLLKIIFKNADKGQCIPLSFL